MIVINGNGSSVGGRLQFLVFLQLRANLELVVINDVLVGGTALRERVQLIHVVHVVPDAAQLVGNLEVREVLAC